jgi:predicted dehydrogenase
MRLLAEDFQVPLARWSRYLQNVCEIRSYPGALPFQRTFFILIRRLLAFLNEKSEKPPVSPEEGLRAVRILEATRESLASGQPQSVRQAD